MKSTITPETMATVVAIATVGGGVPTYFFSGYDIIDAISEGFVVIQNDNLFLTAKGQSLLDEYQIEGKITSYEPVLTNKTKGFQ